MSQGFIDVVLPIPLARHFTYSVAREDLDHLVKGLRVAVPFGKKKSVYGYCMEHP